MSRAELLEAAKASEWLSDHLKTPNFESCHEGILFAHYVDKIELIGTQEGQGVDIQLINKAVEAAQALHKQVIDGNCGLVHSYYLMLFYEARYQKYGWDESFAIYCASWGDLDEIQAFERQMKRAKQNAGHSELGITKMNFLGRPFNEFMDHVIELSWKFQDYKKDHERKRAARRGYVYLLKSITGHYKIGRTRQLQRRVRKLEVKLPFEVELEHVIFTADCFALEKDLHTHFTAQRLEGEWFKLAEADIDYIKALPSLPAD